MLIYVIGLCQSYIPCGLHDNAWSNLITLHIRFSGIYSPYDRILGSENIVTLCCPLFSFFFFQKVNTIHYRKNSSTLPQSVLREVMDTNFFGLVATRFHIFAYQLLPSIANSSGELQTSLMLKAIDVDYVEGVFLYCRQITTKKIAMFLTHCWKKYSNLFFTLPLCRIL